MLSIKTESPNLQIMLTISASTFFFVRNSTSKSVHFYSKSSTYLGFDVGLSFTLELSIFLMMPRLDTVSDEL